MWIFTYNIERELRLTLTESYLAVGRVDVSCRSPGSNSWDPFSPNSSQPRRNTPRLSCSENTNTHTERKKEREFQEVTFTACEATEAPARSFPGWSTGQMQQTYWTKYYVPFFSQLTNRQIKIPAQQKSDTTHVFSHLSYQIMRLPQI